MSSYLNSIFNFFKRDANSDQIEQFFADKNDTKEIVEKVEKVNLFKRTVVSFLIPRLFASFNSYNEEFIKEETLKILSTSSYTGFNIEIKNCGNSYYRVEICPQLNENNIKHFIKNLFVNEVETLELSSVNFSTEEILLLKSSLNNLKNYYTLTHFNIISGIGDEITRKVEIALKRKNEN